jgi:hypothetical protein
VSLCDINYHFDSGIECSLRPLTPILNGSSIGFKAARLPKDVRMNREYGPSFNQNKCGRASADELTDLIVITIA